MKDLNENEAKKISDDSLEQANGGYAWDSFDELEAAENKSPAGFTVEQIVENCMKMIDSENR